LNRRRFRWTERLKLDASDIEKHQAILKDLIDKAYRNWVGE